MTTATPITEAFEALMPEPVILRTLHADRFPEAPFLVRGYTADQLHEAIRAATERAAKLCDELVYALDNGGNRYRREADASKCAAAIRASGGMGASDE
jgi:hypothetical protein